MRTTKVFDKTSAAYLQHPRYISSCGGTRSGKTFSILQLLYIIALGQERRGDKPQVISVVSESMPHLRRGAIRDFQSILQSEGVWQEEKWSKSNKTYTFDNGTIIEYFSVDDAGKVFGAARDILFINECQHIDYETFRQLAVRTRGIILLDYNPTHEFWVMQHIEGRPNCVRLHSTFLDNDFLTDAQKAEILSNKDDANWWRVFGEGEVGTLDGLIYEFKIIDALPELSTDLIEIQGLDFGFTNDPTARVQIYADPKRKKAYIRQRCYRTGMMNKHIASDLKADNVSRNTPIYADCAEPKSIAELKDEGFKVIACDKDAPVKSQKLLFQIQWVQGWEMYVTADSLDWIHEGRNYSWAKTKTGELLNEPIDKFNHLLDATRYALWSHFGKSAGKGRYNISMI